MAKAFLHHFTVRGKGHFPLDMIRYDRCTPRSGEDVNQLCERHDSPVSVNLIHVGPKEWTPTEGRWNSFGWAVTKQGEKYDAF